MKVTLHPGARMPATPEGWQLVLQDGIEVVFERKGASAADVLVWIRMLEGKEVRGLEFTRISDP